MTDRPNELASRAAQEGPAWLTGPPPDGRRRDNGPWPIPWQGRTAMLEVPRRAFGSWPVTIDGIKMPKLRPPSNNHPWVQMELPGSSPPIVLALAWRPRGLWELDIFVDGISQRDGRPFGEVKENQPVPPDTFLRGAGQLAILGSRRAALAFGAIAEVVFLPTISKFPEPGGALVLLVWFCLTAGWAYVMGTFARRLAKRTEVSPAKRGCLLLLVAGGTPFWIMLLLYLVYR